MHWLIAASITTVALAPFGALAADLPPPVAPAVYAPRSRFVPLPTGAVFMLAVTSVWAWRATRAPSALAAFHSPPQTRGIWRSWRCSGGIQLAVRRARPGCGRRF